MIVISPTDLWLKSALRNCTATVSIASPYVGDYLSKAVGQLDDKIDVTLLTRTLLTDFASSASDLDAVHALAQRAGGVLSLSTLHAKVYIVDNKRALITSANATASGMYRNRECGFEIARHSDLESLRTHIVNGFGSNPKPQLWSADDLERLRQPVEALRVALPKFPRTTRAAAEALPRIHLHRRQYERLIESFSGWLQLTIEGIARIDSPIFTMNEVIAACAPLATARFPANQHVREKLRQQMQRLRDLGLVQFLGKGRYELLASQRS